MNAKQYERWLKKEHNIEIFDLPGTGHIGLKNPANGRKSQMPRHGGRKQLGKGLIEKIKKDLGIK